jgi:hypothetical protein
MNSQLRRWPLVTVLALALLVPAGATAQTPTKLPVGEAKGVRLVLDHGSIVLIFSDKARKLRKLANSRYAWIDCTEFGEPFSLGGGGNLDAPPRGRRVNTGIEGTGDDYCRFYLRAHTVKHGNSRNHVPRRILASIPITQEGAVYLDEEKGAIKLFRASLDIALVKDQLKLSGSPTYDQVVAAYPGAAKVLAPLATPDAAPPPKRVGYYSDGAEHTAFAILSTLGKRLFIEQSAGEVLTTNVSAHLFSLGEL